MLGRVFATSVPLPKFVIMSTIKLPVEAFSVVPVERLDVGFAPRPWRFADERRCEIDAHFADLQRRNPALWNGRVLLLGDFAIRDGVFCGACFPVDYASFVSWQNWNFPDLAVHDCFAMASILSSDGAFLLGEMAPHTFNAGQIYFPCGTPDLNDVDVDRVDFDRSVARELKEETGLDISDFAPDPGWHAVLGGALVALMKVLRARETAAELRERALDHLASEKRPELSDIRIVRGPADLDPAMPSFVISFLRHAWSRGI
jgi:8-oxo-dGTP pyrophosphatase MutT (NUDIX family)